MDSLGENDLAFFGAVTASISHELNNVMATIEQTAGILEDAAADRESLTMDKGQMEDIAQKIARQTRRGAQIIKRLRAFAHSIDEADGDIEIGDLIKNVAALAQRLADKERVRLDPRPCAGRLIIRNNFFRVQQALYLSIQKAVSAAPPESGVSLSVAQQGSGVHISLESSSKPSVEDTDFSFLEILMRQIGGKIASTNQDGRLTIKLVL